MIKTDINNLINKTIKIPYMHDSLFGNNLFNTRFTNLNKPIFKSGIYVLPYAYTGFFVVWEVGLCVCLEVGLCVCLPLRA